MDELHLGSSIVICAKGDFYAYVDGWKGRVISFQGALITVLATNPDGQEVQLLVPREELRLDK